MPKHLLIIDASGFAHRAYHASYARYRSDGLPTWAIEGFVSLMWRLLGQARADAHDYAVAAFDAPGPSFRRDLFPEYKTNRPARKQELTAQLPWMHHAARVMGVCPVEVIGFEADDIIATLAEKARKAGVRTTIVSSDKDFHQCVRAGWVEIVDPLGGRIDHVAVTNGKFGVDPSLVPDVQALAGDEVDNIPGIDGVGLRRAAGLIRLFHSVEGVIEAATAQPHHFPPAVRNALKKRGTIDRLRLYRTLATLRTDAPVRFDRRRFAAREILRGNAELLLIKLEARGRMDAIFPGEPMLERESAPQSDDMHWWRTELTAPGQAVPDEPQCGFYVRRLVRGGPWVACRIWREKTIADRWILQCTIGGRARDPVQEWPVIARRPIKQERYEYLMANADWAKNHAPHEPEANPEKAIDWNQVPL